MQLKASLTEFLPLRSPIVKLPFVLQENHATDQIWIPTISSLEHSKTHTSSLLEGAIIETLKKFKDSSTDIYSKTWSIFQKKDIKHWNLGVGCFLIYSPMPGIMSNIEVDGWSKTPNLKTLIFILVLVCTVVMGINRE